MSLQRKAIFAAVSALLSCSAFAAGFSKVNEYKDEFTDIPENAWYASEVKNIYELGLMNGIGAGLFNPEGNVTVAEAVTMAARATASYMGETISTSDGEWYRMYVNYAVSKGFVKDGQFDSFDRPAKRYEVAQIFENAMPESYFTATNDVDKIPDVSEKQSYYADLMNLYKAGIVMGSDSYGNFKPEDNITRAEAAAIINRVALPENRLKKTLDKVSEDEAYTLVITTGYNAAHGKTVAPLMSGWLLDNRGGVPRTSLTASYGALYDISEKAGTAYIREFNETSTGKISASVSLLSEDDGIYVSFSETNDNDVYRLERKDGKWMILGADGSSTELYEIKDGESTFNFNIILDLDNSRSTTYINGVPCGTHSLVKDNTAVSSFRFATTKESTATLTPGSVYMYVNYPVYEDFVSTAGDGKLPLNWIGTDGAEVSSEQLSLENATAAYSFDVTSGNIAAEFMVLLPESEKISYALNSGTKNIAVFTTDETGFYLNGEKIYDNYVPNLWYRLRFELDTETMTIDAKVNGRYTAENIAFAEKSTSVDNISLTNKSETAAFIDNVRVFRTLTHDDYVPVPVKPAGEEKYNVGINVCSLWKNGENSSWASISPFSDIEPVLGYYDEGNPETADWEIKYLLEHGIDFQAFCVYFNSVSGVQRLNASHLFDGFMNAKYSDMAKYCIIWEAANAASPDSVESFKKNYLPYLVENFFKDARYMTIDNRPVLCVFGPDKLAQRIGGNDKVKEMFDILEAEVKKLGFDGMIYLYCGSSGDAYAAMGFDGAYAYNWGISGYDPERNKLSMNSSASNKSVFTVPTVSVGFNNVGWTSERHPLMTAEDYEKVHTWVKEEFSKTNAPTEKWQENFVMISTWNEYGEGTYIMPCDGLNGFGYLDVIRSHYSDADRDESVNLRPTENQKKRINRLYPQYRHILHKEGHYVSGNDGVKSIIINGNKYTMQFAVKDAGHDKLIAFDPACGLDFTLGAFYRWDKDNKVLTLDFAEHRIVFTADSDKYTVNGNEHTLGYKLPMVDGLPMIPVEKVCAAVGYTYSVNENGEIVIDTDMKAYFDEKRQKKDGEWAFETLGDAEGWTTSNMEMAVSDGVLHLNVIEGTDPRMFSAKKLNMPAEKYKSVEVRVKYDHNSDKTQSITFFYITDVDSGWGEDKAFRMYHSGSSSDGEFVTYSFDLTGAAKWKDTITQLRFDPFGTTGTMDVDYIRFEVNPDYVSPEPEEALPEGELIRNGNAELEKPSFRSNNGNISITADPDNPGNNCYLMLPKNNSKVWLYSVYDTEFVPGGEYKASMKVKLASNGAKIDENGEDFTATVLCNARYYEQKAVDHIVARKTLKKSDGWVDWEFTFTVSEESSDRSQDLFNIYSDPVNDMGVGYYFDDVTVTLVNTEDKTPEETEVVLPDGEHIINGDAEGQSYTLSSGNGKLSVVTDPENMDNNCYLVLPQNDKSAYIYTEQKTEYKPGETYTAFCDIKLASLGTELTDEDFAAVVRCNVIYKDGSTSDHLVAKKTVKLSDGWVRFEFEFTVAETGVGSSNNRFRIYVDPVNNMGVGYYLDNISLKMN